MNKISKRIWFITGISSGLGKALTQTVMESGDFVIGTFRNQTQTDDFNQTQYDTGWGITLDITQLAEIDKVVGRVTEKFGSIDVLVNNAGFGFAGAIEETSMSEARMVFEANFFGALALTQSFLPAFREQKRGHIIQISSHGGFKAFPGFGIYNASKFALEGFSEALSIELAPLGVKLTLVEPGPFRTNFAGNAFKEAEKVIDDYSETAGAFRQRMRQVNGKQEGDPQKAAKAIVDITRLKTPPLRLPLGKIAIASMTAKLDSVRNDMDTYRNLAESAVF